MEYTAIRIKTASRDWVRYSVGHVSGQPILNDLYFRASDAKGLPDEFTITIKPKDIVDLPLEDLENQPSPDFDPTKVPLEITERSEMTEESEVSSGHPKRRKSKKNTALAGASK